MSLTRQLTWLASRPASYRSVIRSKNVKPKHQGWNSKALTDFESDQLSLVALKECIEINGPALESVPYKSIEDIDEIEYQLTQCQFFDEEFFECNIEPAISFIKCWLNNFPK
ncbi:hypothetical protein ABMA58_12040 [Oceanospirillum sp. HFRX-1_2]